MARFYFHVRDGDDVAFDDEGIDFASIAEVEIEAVLSLTDISRSRLARRNAGQSSLCSIDVRDHGGKHVLMASLVVAIHPSKLH